MTRKTKIVITLSCLLFNACASVDVVRTKTVASKPKDCSLDVYTEPSSVKRSYEVVCLLSSVTGSTLFADKSVSGAIENSKPEACKCGADAILIDNVAKKPMGYMDYGHGSANVKAIRYTDSK